MKKIISSFLICFIILSVGRPQEASAEIPPKAKAFLVITGYGAGGGALLGVASLAFGSSTKAIAKGASLGLYAGILFGAYVLISHHNKQFGDYEDNSSPYSESKDIYGDDYNSEEGGGEEDSGATNKNRGFFDRIQLIQENMYNQSFTFHSVKKKNSLPPIQMNIIQYNF